MCRKSSSQRQFLEYMSRYGSKKGISFVCTSLYQPSWAIKNSINYEQIVVYEKKQSKVRYTNKI